MKLRVAPGTLLAAAPDMLDPNFMHTVVLLCQHTEEGAYGLVVNKSAAVRLDELLAGHPVLGRFDAPVWWGGPVGLETLQILHRIPDGVRGSLEVGEGLFLGGELEAIARHLDAHPDARGSVRFVIGYSGWGEGQLDGELASGSWLPAKLELDAVFAPDQEPTWRRVVRSVGERVSGLENLPPDVSWN